MNCPLPYRPSRSRSHYLLIAFVVIHLSSAQSDDSSDEHQVHPFRWDEDVHKIRIDKLNSTSVNITCENLANTALLPLSQRHRTGNFELKLTYLPNLATLNFKTNVLDSKLCERSNSMTINILSVDVNDDIENCKGRLYNFGHYNDTHDENHSRLQHYCEPRDIFLKSSDGHGCLPVVINNLLPHRAYKFYNSGVIFRDNKSDNYLDTTQKLIEEVCMPDSKPLFAPQTDLSSFQIVHPPQGAPELNTRMIDLYWRPVPPLLAGSDGLRHEILCRGMPSGRIAANQTLDMLIGRMGISALDSDACVCSIRSKNRLGYADNSSLIMIPQKEKVIEFPEKFNFYGASVAHGHYILRWTDLEPLLMDEKSIKNFRITATNSSFTNAYTVYWCIAHDPINGCSSIDGMAKTKSTLMPLIIPGEIMASNLMFGISYRGGSNKFATGIKWLKCIAPLHTQSQSFLDSLDINKGLGISSDKISLSWRIKGCASITALVQRYEVDICKVRDSDPCKPTLFNRTSYDFENNPNCTRRIFENTLDHEATLDNLEASKVYAIRIRQTILEPTISNETIANHWSEAVSVQTLSDPREHELCPAQERALSVVVFVIASSIVVLSFICYLARKVFLLYWRFIVKLKQTNAGVTRRVEEILNKRDDLSETGLKYWINRRLSYSDESLNSGSTLDCYELDSKKGIIKKLRANSEANKVQPGQSIIDYVPHHVLAGGENQTGACKSDESIEEYSAVSDMDEYSITSHSSFLERILNDDKNSNDRQSYEVEDNQIEQTSQD